MESRRVTINDMVAPPKGFKVVGLREQAHGAVVEQLAVTRENIDEVFVKMRSAVLAEVDDGQGHARTVVCREVGSRRMILLLEPLNARATAETLTLDTFVTRYSRVVVSFNP